MSSKLEANPQTTADLAELVVAAYDGSRLDGIDPREAARLAARVVIHMLRHAARTWPARRQ